MLTVPPNFAENWQTMTAEELAEHHGIATQTVTRICKQLGLKRTSKKVHTPLRPMPEGFAEHAYLTENALRIRYNCGYAAVRRWRKELGVDVARQRIIDRAPATYSPGVEDQRVSIAARYLQKTRPVHRCDAGGRFGGGTHWRCGREVLTDAALVSKAVAMGWDAEEWRRVA